MNHKSLPGVLKKLKRHSFTKEERQSVSHTILHDFEPSGKPKPTNHQPGTIEKIEVLHERVRNGHPLWVPGDAVFKRREQLSDNFTDVITCFRDEWDDEYED